MKETSSELLKMFEKYGELKKIDNKFMLRIERGLKENVVDPVNKIITDETNKALKATFKSLGLKYEEQGIYNNGNKNKIIQIGYIYLTFDPKYSNIALKLCKCLYNEREVS